MREVEGWASMSGVGVEGWIRRDDGLRWSVWGLPAVIEGNKRWGRWG